MDRGKTHGKFEERFGYVKLDARKGVASRFCYYYVIYVLRSAIEEA